MLTDGCQRPISAEDSGRRHASVLLQDRVVGRLQVALTRDPLTMEERARNSAPPIRSGEQTNRPDSERTYVANEIISSALGPNHRTWRLCNKC